MSSVAPSPIEDKSSFDMNLQHGHKDLVQAVAFNTYGDRCATGSVDGKIRVFNRHRDGTWRLCDSWSAHGGEVLELQWLPSTVYPNLLASLGIEGWFRLWAEDPSAPAGRRFSAGGSRLSSSTSSTAPPAPPAAAAPASTPAPGTSSTAPSAPRPAFGTRSGGRGAPYRSFNMRHVDDGAARHTYLALLAADGRLTVLENDQPDNLAEYTPVDEFTVCPRPSRGEEVSFRVRFDPSPEPCYAAQRSGVGADSLGIVVAAMDQVRVYRSRDVVATSYGVHSTRKEFYLAADLNDAATAPTAANAPAYASAPAATHRGLVRDVAWAPGNIRGYDTIATACQDGFSRVFRLDTPLDPSGPGPTGTNTNTSWSQAAVFAASAPVDNTPATTAASTPPAGPSSAPTDGTATPVTTEQAAAAAATPTSTSEPTPATADASPADAAAEEGDDEQEDDIPDDGSVSTAAVDSPISQQDQTHQTQHQLPPHITNPLHQPHHHPSSTLSASLAHSNAAAARDRVWSGAPGQVKHQAHLVSKLGDAFRTPVWRIGFDDDGQILGTTGDDGKLVCFRQTPDGSWALSSELAMMRARMVAP